MILACHGSWDIRAADSNPPDNGVRPIPIAELKHAAAVDFNREILPVLRNNCLACHNRTTAKARLVLETPADMLKGGDSGPALQPGKGSSSLMLRAAAHELEDTVMPPPGNKARASDLTSEELALLKQWIDQGATATGPVRVEPEWQPLPKGLNPIYAVAITRDGQFAACGRANRIDVYHLPTRRMVTRLTDSSSTSGSAHRDLVQSLDFDPAGTLLASGAYREIKLWRRPTDPAGLRIEPVPGAPVTCLAASPDGKWFATGATDGRIRIWSTASGKPRRVLSRHRGPVTSLAFSPDALFLVSGSTDKALQIWSLTDGRPVASAQGPTGINAVTWLPSGLRLASGGDDHLIRIWDIDRNRPTLHESSALRGHTGPVRALAGVGTNYNQILSGSADGTLRLWDVTAGTPLREMKHVGAVTAVAVRPDGRRFASAGMDRTTRLWDAADGRLVAELRGDKRAQEQVADYERESAFWKTETQFYNSARKSAETNQTAQTDRVAKAGSAEDAANKELQEKRKQLAEAKDAQAVAEQAAAEARAEPGPTTPPSEPAGNTARQTQANAAAASPAPAAGSAKTATDPTEREKQAAEKLKAASKKVSEAETALKRAEQKCSNAQTESELSRKALDEAGKAVARIVQSAAETVRSQEESAVALKYSRLEAAQHHLPVRALAFSPDNLCLATAGDDRLAHLWSADDGTPFDTFRGHVDSIIGTTYASEGVLITAGADHRLQLWKADAPWTLTRRLGSGDADSPLADRVNALRFSPDGTRLAAGGGEPTRGGEITLWNPANGQLLRSYPNVHSDAVFAVDFNRDGSRLATAAADRFAKVLDLDSGTVLRPLEGHTHHVLGVSWKHDGRTLATAGADNLVKVWEFPSGDRKKNVTGFDKEVTSIRFVGYTDQALTTSGDGKVRLVKEDGSEVRSFAGAADYVYSAATTPDGRFVIAGGQDGILRVWNGTDGKLITAFPPPENN